MNTLSSQSIQKAMVWQIGLITAVSIATTHIQNVILIILSTVVFFNAYYLYDVPDPILHLLHVYIFPFFNKTYYYSL